MKVLFLTGREHSYSRNAVLLEAFQHFAHVDIAIVPEKGSIIKRSLYALAVAIRKPLHAYDLIFVGFYGYLILQVIARLTQTPILFDAFVSNYDTLCFDRQVFRPNSLAGKFTYWLDKSSLTMATHVLIDTPSHASYMSETFHIEPKYITAIPVGCQDHLFSEQQENGAFDASTTTVLFYCSYQPLHGVETVIRAADSIRQENIQIEIVGTGQERDKCEQIATALQLTNVKFTDPVPVTSLNSLISSAHIALGGHFGTSSKADRTVPGKIYQLLASGSTIIATSTTANLATLTPNHDALLVPPNDYRALSKAIIRLHKSPDERKRLSRNAHITYTERFSQERITDMMHVLAKQIVEHPESLHRSSKPTTKP